VCEQEPLAFIFLVLTVLTYAGSISPIWPVSRLVIEKEGDVAPSNGIVFKRVCVPLAFIFLSFDSTNMCPRPSSSISQSLITKLITINSI